MINLARHFPIFVVIIPIISAIIIPPLSRINRSIAWYITFLATLFTFLASYSLLGSVMDGGKISYWLGGWEPPWGIEYVIDYISGFVLVIVSFIAFIVSIYAKSSVEKEISESKRPAFYAVYLLLIAGLMGMTITGDIFNLYVFIEISALAGYALVAMGKKRTALIASYNYLILGTIGATFILLGIGYLYMATGTLNMADLREQLPMLYDSTLVRTAFAFFTVGLSLKLALFPLHIWLPNVYSESPSVVSVIMAAISTKVSAYVLFRIMFTVFKLEFDMQVIPFTKILLLLAAIAILAGSILALAQTNIKRMLAYSSVGQIGYIVLGAAIANRLAMTGSLIHILNHALMTGALFMVIGAVVYKTGIVEISQFKGLGKKMPVTMALFTIGALSMIGFPITVGFVSKWYLATGALEAGMWYFVPIILTSSLLTAVYLWRVIEFIYFHPQSDTLKAMPAGIDEAPVGMILPTFVLAILCIFFGLAASIPVNVASAAAKMLLGTN